MRRRRILARWMLLCLLPLLTSCSSSVQTLDTASLATLPPADSPYVAPLGTEDMGFSSAWPLYRPTLDGQNLTASVVTLGFEHGISGAQVILSSLFSQMQDASHQRLGGDLGLYLSGRLPVEVAGHVCTVQLDTSAISQSADSLYTAGLCIASSLYGLDGIRYVNLLSNERALGMDLTDNLPMGTLTRHSGVELPVLIQQMEARSTPLGVDPATVPLTSTVTLYFPLASGDGFVPEVQNLTFQGQTPQLLSRELLAALSAGSQYTEGTAALPDLLSMLARDIEVSELTGGGRLISLYFTSNLTETLSQMGLDPSAVIGAIVYTLTTFIPAVGAVRIFSGSTLMTSLSGSTFPALSFDEGLQKRRQYTSGLRDLTSVYLARDDRLAQVTRAVPSASAAAPALLLNLLSKGPTSSESAQGLSGVFPLLLDETDLLGIGVADQTLLINLSAACEAAIRTLDADAQQRLAYAMVLTLCDALGTNRVRFFFDSAVPAFLGTDFFWGGEFMYNDSLLDKSRG